MSRDVWVSRSSVSYALLGTFPLRRLSMFAFTALYMYYGCNYFTNTSPSNVDNIDVWRTHTLRDSRNFAFVELLGSFSMNRIAYRVIRGRKIVPCYFHRLREWRIASLLANFSGVPCGRQAERSIRRDFRDDRFARSTNNVKL